ncbi:hypothetical protein L484_021238 [Morus notabilis]|uniref:Uncharacterized protein n=1 Tax=Morus notabilis TaxID=981085 RepID=W9RSZ0_9ROSA|nr:hypothetical protein L484_021238 [Morus notabilis]
MVERRCFSLQAGGVLVFGVIFSSGTFVLEEQWTSEGGILLGQQRWAAASGSLTSEACFLSKSLLLR